MTTADRAMHVASLISEGHGIDDIHVLTGASYERLAQITAAIAARAESFAPWARMAARRAQCRPRRPTSELLAIVADAARDAGCTVDQMVGYGRAREVVEARHAAMRRAYEAGYSMPQIGRAFDRDPTTVHHAIRKAVKRAPKALIGGRP